MNRKRAVVPVRLYRGKSSPFDQLRTGLSKHERASLQWITVIGNPYSSWRADNEYATEDRCLNAGEQLFSLPWRARRSKETACAVRAVALTIQRGRSFAVNAGVPSRRAVYSAALRISPRPSSVGSVALRSRSSLVSRVQRLESKKIRTLNLSP